MILRISENAVRIIWEIIESENMQENLVRKRIEIIDEMRISENFKKLVKTRTIMKFKLS